MKKRIFSCMTASILTISLLPSSAFAEEAPVPFDVEEAVYAQLMEQDYLYDTNEDGIITEEEMKQSTQIYLELEGVTDISWLASLENVTYVSLTGGTLTDFSVLKEMPKLRVVAFYKVPVEDISYLKDLKLEALHLDGVEGITLEERLEILEWNDITIGVGFADQVGATPVGVLDEYMVTMRIKDESIAEFTNRRYGVAGPIQDVYGIKQGSTTYEMLIDGEVINSGKITVTETKPYDPPLHAQHLGKGTIADSSHYSTYNVLLRSGMLYGIKGAKAEAMEKNVKDYDHIYMKDEKGNYQYADLVLKEDGTLLANGKSISDKKFVQLENGCAITADNAIYLIHTVNGAFKPIQLGTNFKEFPYISNYYYTSQSGEVIFYKASFNTSDELVVTTTKTGIKNPIASDTNLFVDGDGVLWSCKTYPAFSKSRVAENVVDVAYIQMTNGGSGYAYTTKDGTIISIASGKPVTPVEEQKWQSYAEDGAFYIHDYMEKLQSENDCLVHYFIMDDRTMTISFVDKNFAITNVQAAICAEFDAETQQGYLYFLRTDGSLWRYALETQECIDLDAEPVAPTEPEPTEPKPTEPEPTEPNPTEPKPTEPEPTEPKPTEPKPTEPEPTEPKPTESKPTEPEPTEPKPTEPVAGDVNGDEKFSVVDVIAFQRWLLNDGTKLANATVADLTKDERLNAFDLGAMKHALIADNKK